jgi:hypothetical protein
MRCSHKLYLRRGEGEGNQLMIGENEKSIGWRPRIIASVCHAALINC